MLSRKDTYQVYQSRLTKEKLKFKEELEVQLTKINQINFAKEANH
jgi:hypothetical protein